MDLYNLHMVPHTIPWRNFNFPRSTDKIQFFDKISSSGKIYEFNEVPKYKHQSIFSLLEKVKLNFRER